MVNVERAVNRQPGYHARTRRADIPKESNKLFPETQIFEIFQISEISGKYPKNLLLRVILT